MKLWAYFIPRPQRVNTNGGAVECDLFAIVAVDLLIVRVHTDLTILQFCSFVHAKILSVIKMALM